MPTADEHFDRIYGAVVALDAVGGTERWTPEFPDFVYTSPAVAGASVVVGCLDWFVYALDTADGTGIVRYEAGAPVLSSPAVAQGVFVGDDEGRPHALSR